ncbi:MAG: YciI family protein [Pseudomonadota bacterium]
MPVYAFYCRDGEDAPKIRPTVRKEHFEHIFAQVGAYRLGGPLKQDGADVGSLILIEGKDEAAARAIFEADPYYIRGVWQSITVTEFVAQTGTWRPGEDGV